MSVQSPERATSRTAGPIATVNAVDECNAGAGARRAPGGGFYGGRVGKATPRIREPVLLYGKVGGGLKAGRLQKENNVEGASAAARYALRGVRERLREGTGDAGRGGL